MSSSTFAGKSAAATAGVNGNVKGGVLKNVELAEIFAMDEITHYNRLPSDTPSNFHNSDSLFSIPSGANFTYDFASDEDSDILHSDDIDKDTVPVNTGHSSSKKHVNPFVESEISRSLHQTGDRSGASTISDYSPRMPSRTPSLISNTFVIDIKRSDVMLDSFIFFVMLAEFCLDVTLAILHYENGRKWAAGFSSLFILFGAASILHQFNHMEKDQVKALFDRGKRIGILISCFPPLGTILCSYQCMVIGIKSTQDPMISSRYLEIENFSKNLYKRQSFFQAAPQAALQLVVFIHSLKEQSISFGNGMLVLFSIVVSIIVMTNSSIPSKAENHRFHIYQSPSQRIFIGIRMFSSFASRIMAVTSLFVGLQCMTGFENEYLTAGTVMAIVLLAVPRLIFTFVEFARQVVEARGPGSSQLSQNVEASAFSSAFSFKKFQQILIGYLATILFPVGDPIWVFWYIWIESAIFAVFGNGIAWYMGCFSTAANCAYLSLFVILHIIVPIFVPYVKDTAKRMQVRRIQKLVHESTLETPTY